MPAGSRLRAAASAWGLAAALLLPAAAGGAGKPPLRLTIAFTGDVGGYLEPCG
jgi:hypothetical protein